MSDVPKDLRYTRQHEWVRRGSDGVVVIGITDHAQQQLGELVYVELPEAGRGLKPADAMAVVESTKAASDVYAPIAGTIESVNADLTTRPELVNTDPYGAGWLVSLRPTDAGHLDELLDAVAYAALVAATPD